ncbi:protein of unknown function [Brevefilum fermentans]|uniref:Uncharacterized protein n=1 Tax=Candidatus Brevifilum fermentans TaxID=1986204 RepID=A0A1Y6K6Q3_9CHLR|nr:protein of unknown function [Brevefilum fermentans]
MPTVMSAECRVSAVSRKGAWGPSVSINSPMVLPSMMSPTAMRITRCSGVALGCTVAEATRVTLCKVGTVVETRVGLSVSVGEGLTIAWDVFVKVGAIVTETGSACDVWQAAKSRMRTSITNKGRINSLTIGMVGGFDAP